jgi:hypothetical protein
LTLIEWLLSFEKTVLKTVSNETRYDPLILNEKRPSFEKPFESPVSNERDHQLKNKKQIG